MSPVLDLILFLLPVYAANSAPVILGGGPPLDGGIKLGDKKRFLGKSKTLRGFIAGVLGGTVMGGLIGTQYLLPFFSSTQEQFIAFFLVGVGTMGGDLIGSFIKRRMGIPPSGPFFPETLLYVAVPLLFVFPLADGQLYEPLNIIFFLGLGLAAHRLANIWAKSAGLKKVPW